MNKTLRKIFLASLGVAAVTEEKAKVLLNDLIKKGEISEKEAKGMINEILKKAEKGQVEIEKTLSAKLKNVEGEVKKLVKKMNLATQDDIDRIEKKLNELKKKKQR